MAIVDIMALEPTSISRDLKNKYIMLYSKPKVGKTTFAAQIPNNLILCFEKGVNFLSGIYAADIPQWSDFKAILRQLAKDAAKERYKTITIDTVSIAWTLCEQYICQSNQVSTIGDIPYGKGYALLTQEFSSALRELSMMGYGIILIAHAKIKNTKIDDETTIETVAPSIPDRAQDIVNALVDVIGYIDVQFDEQDNSTRTLITRGTSRIVAGSRLKYISPRISFGYQELVDEMIKAIELEEKLDGARVTDNDIIQATLIRRPFAETLAEARDLWIQYVRDNEERAEKILDKVETLFGRRMKLSDIPENKQDLFEVLIDEIHELISSANK